VVVSVVVLIGALVLAARVFARGGDPGTPGTRPVAAAPAPAEAVGGQPGESLLAADPQSGTPGPDAGAAGSGSPDAAELAAREADAQAAAARSRSAAPPATKAAAKASPTKRPADPTTTGPESGSGSGSASVEAAVLALVNAERAKVGCGALTIDARLTAAAHGHSADMAARNYFAHDTPEGVGMAQRVTQAGYKWSAVAENIAMGYPDASSVMTGWMNSTGHRTNILNCVYRDIGIGVVANAKGSKYWTQDFGTPA
jgi:uncharacterized protein YkwD